MISNYFKQNKKMVNKTKKAKFLVLVLISTVIFSFNVFSNSDNYFVSIKLDSKNPINIEKYQLPVYYQSTDVLFTVIDKELISEINQYGNNVAILDKYEFSNKYFIVSYKQIVSKNEIEKTFNKCLYYSNYFSIIQSDNLIENQNIDKKFFSNKLERTKRVFSISNDVKMNYSISKSSDSLILNSISCVNTDSIRRYIQKLQDFGTRFSGASNRKEVAKWIKNKFNSFGLQNVRIDSFVIYGNGIPYWQYNVIATITGSENPNEHYIVGGHHDATTNGQSIPPVVASPGADDNASGAAAALEIARIIKLKNYQPKKTLIFATFAAEEQGLLGGRDFASKEFQSNKIVKMMLNFDMISNKNLSTNTRYNLKCYTGANSLSEMVMYVNSKYSQMVPNVTCTNSSGSDSYAFWEYNFPSIYFEEYSFSPFYHSLNDSISHCDMNYCANIIKIGLSSLLYGLEYPSKLNYLKLNSLTNGSSVKATWQRSKEIIAGYRLYLGSSANTYDSIINTTDTTYVFNNLTENKEYYIGVSTYYSNNNESEIFIKKVTPTKISLNKGILIVQDSKGGLNNPDDSVINKFYMDLCQGFTCSLYKAVDSNKISLSKLGEYSTVIWYINKKSTNNVFKKSTNEIENYLDLGGKLIVNTYTPSYNILGNTVYPAVLSNDNFMFNYLKIKNVNLNSNARFSGALPISTGYNGVNIDTNKVAYSSTYGFQIKDVESINPNSEGTKIYSYITKSDTSTTMGSMQGQPIGVEYIGSNFKTVTLSFPLFYMNLNESKNLIHYILTSKFHEDSYVKEYSKNNNYFDIYQPYPNPASKDFTLNYFVNEDCKLNISLFDINGKILSILVDQKQTKGFYKLMINTNNLENGIYYIKANNDKQSKTVKAVIIK